MPLKKKICVVTSTRADYGLLYWLMKKIGESRLLELQLVVTGTHLSAAHGNTFKYIEADGFRIGKKIAILAGNDIAGIGGGAANTLKKFTAYFSEERPDAVVLLGDRFEIMAVAQSAAIAAIPVIHLHGGEVSEGANDDMFRHAITKLSSFHFTSNKQHRNRVIQMGEEPARVKVAGALGVENINKLALLSRSALEELYKIKFRKKIFLVTFHPATLEKESPEKQFA